MINSISILEKLADDAFAKKVQAAENNVFPGIRSE